MLADRGLEVVVRRSECGLDFIALAGAVGEQCLQTGGLRRGLSRRLFEFELAALPHRVGLREPRLERLHCRITAGERVA